MATDVLTNPRQISILEALHTIQGHKGYFATKNPRANFEGLIVYDKGSHGSPTGYLQLFRNGIVEWVTTNCCTVRSELDHPVFSPTRLADDVTQSVSEFVEILRTLDFGSDYLLAVDLLRVGGALLAARGRHFSDFTDEISKEDLALPVVQVSALDDRPSRLAATRPMFDALWNAVGEFVAPYFDGSGNWVGP